jgi:putative peptide zinc metalloprotease protein
LVVSRHARRLAATALLTCASALPGGSAQAATGENVAFAEVTTDQGSAFDSAWDIERQRGGVVDQLNRAEARASCTGCEATAIAFQIVLAWGRPNPVVPQNVAVAVNENCTGCVAAAHARQFVRVLDAPSRLTGAGRAELAQVRNALRALERQDLPPDQLYTAVEAQEARVKDVLDHELVLKADPGEEPEVIDQELRQRVDVD